MLRSHRRTGIVRCPALALCLACALIPFASVRTATGADSSEPRSTREYLDRMAERYAPLENAAPEQTRGTGFKPYHRYRWLAEPRLNPETGDQDPGARWEAWKQLREMEKEFGTRSETWFNVGPVNVAGRCLAIEVHPTDTNTAYAGFASSGIWKTTDAGTTWTVLADTLPTLAVSALEIDVTNPDRIWMGTGEGWGNIDAVHGVGILVSTDAGATWSPTGMFYNLNLGRDVFELEYNPATGTLMAATGHGLWRSTDQGATFSLVQSSGDWMDVELQRGSTSVMFACCQNHPNPGFYRSTDDGATWALVTAGTPTTDIGNSRFALTDADSNTIYWAIANSSNGAQKGIWKSTDGGVSFTQVFGAGGHYGGQGWYDITIDVSPLYPNTVFSGGIEFYRSGTGGTSFFQTAGNVHVDHHATAWAPSDPNHFWLGTDGGVWRSTDGGNSFEDKNTGLVTMQFYAFNHAQTDPTLALGGTQDNGTWRYNNSLNWASVLGGDGFYCEIDRVNTNYMYAETYNGNHYRSTNGGNNFYLKMTGIGEAGQWETPTWMDFTDPAIIWTAHNTKIYRTTDRMNTWQWMNNPVGLGGGRSIHQCRDHPGTVVVVGGAKVWVTTNSGATWTDKTGGLVSGNSISDVHCHPNDPNTFVVTLETFSTSTYRQVQKTTNGGTSWFPIDDGLPNEPVNAIEIDPLHPDWYFIGTDLGVYWSSDAGASWVPFNTGLPHVVVDDLRLHDTARLLRAATHGRGLWEVDISNLGSDAAPDPSPAIRPLWLRIFGNPAGATTTVRYGTRQAGQVHLAIYDLQGREVQSILDEHSYGYLGTLDVDVSDLPAGVYFVRLRSQGQEVSEKLVIRR